MKSVLCTFACAAATGYSYNCHPLRSVAALSRLPISLHIQIKETTKVPPHSKLPLSVRKTTNPLCGYKDTSFCDMACHGFTIHVWSDIVHAMSTRRSTVRSQATDMLRSSRCSKCTLQSSGLRQHVVCYYTLLQCFGGIWCLYLQVSNHQPITRRQKPEDRSLHTGRLVYRRNYNTIQRDTPSRHNNFCDIQDSQGIS